MQALDQHEVEGILVDTFAAGSRSDLFNKPSLRIAQVLDYKMAYGIVTAGYAIQLRQCFQEYIISYAADIFHNISNNVKKIEVRLQTIDINLRETQRKEKWSNQERINKPTSKE